MSAWWLVAFLVVYVSMLVGISEVIPDYFKRRRQRLADEMSYLLGDWEDAAEREAVEG